MYFSPKKLEISLTIDDPLFMKEKLKEAYPDYHIKFSSITDIFKVNNKRYKHELWYYPNKLSKITTDRKNSYEQIFAIVIILCLLILKLAFDDKFIWLQQIDHMLFAFVLFGIYAIFNVILYKMKPDYAKDFQDQHDRFISNIKSLNSKQNEED